MYITMPFVGRTEELGQIDKLIQQIHDENLRGVLLVVGEGGIGKTRLLQKVHEQYTTAEGLFVMDIVDFDDFTTRSPESIENQIIKGLGNEAAFATYQQELEVLTDFQRLGASWQTLERHSIRVRQTFIDNLNQFINHLHKTVIFLFDTTEKLKNETAREYFMGLVQDTRNAIFILAGRPEPEVQYLWTRVTQILEHRAQQIEMKPFTQADADVYLQHKEEQMNITFGHDIKVKLLTLAGGKPILIDLAAEWLAREIPVMWREQVNLDSSDMAVDEFEKNLVHNIENLPAPLNRFVLLMSWIYPFSVQMIAQLLDLSTAKSETPEKLADRLFEEAKTLVFVKALPSNLIMLHDEMRRMIDKYLWPEQDPYYIRRRHFSQRYLPLLKQQIAELEQTKEQNSGNQSKDKTKTSAITVEISALKRELLQHTLVVNVTEGVEIFNKLFDDATDNQNFLIRDALLEPVLAYKTQLTETQEYQVEIREVANYLFFGKYTKAVELSTKLELRVENSYQERVEIILHLADAQVRLGQLKAAIVNFQKAVSLCAAHELHTALIPSRNGLGWAYRLTGDIEKAKQIYLETLRLLVEKNNFGVDYGWLLNNLTFVLSERERQNAINMGTTAIAHWEELGDEFGLGAAHSTMGIVYYRSDFAELSLENFNKARHIFTELGSEEWLGRVYSWRGALYQDMGKDKLDDAEHDLVKSLELAPVEMKAMTLNRLGRVYMARGQWAKAKEFMQQSLESAKEIPDYVYWLGSIARLIFIAAESEENAAAHLEEFEQMLDKFTSQGYPCEENSLGMVYLGLGRLALHRDDKVSAAIEYLKKGIQLVTEYGSYARGDIRSRLAHFQKDFARLDPARIHLVGQQLTDFALGKMLKDSRYSLVINITRNWLR